MADGLGLGDAYGATIERIKAQGGDKSRLGMEALMWISFAERPLRVDELCHALAVELGSTDFNTDNVPSMSTLVGCCQGLIIVDEKASIVRLIHFTLKEYLSVHSDIFSRPHSAMAEICLTYLHSEQVKAISADAYPDMLDTPFLEYCSLYWGAHAKRELSAYGMSLALKLLQEYDNHISAKLLFERVDEYGDFVGPSSSLSGLHCASFFGIVDVVAALIEMGCHDINGEDHGGSTPLVRACQYGHEEVVKLLLEQGEVDPNSQDGGGRTPLWHAAGEGHERVVEILLGREEVNPGEPDIDGGTPLLIAAWSGHEEVVRILLRRDEVNPDNQDNAGRTPFWYAAEKGHERVIKMLLGRQEVNPDKLDSDGQTPLAIAARLGREGVVKILLGLEKVNPDKPDNSGRTPLSYAAGNGCGGVVEILLEREEVNINRPDNRGRTPLMFAAGPNHQKVVALLQHHKAVTSSAI